MDRKIERPEEGSLSFPDLIIQIGEDEVIKMLMERGFSEPEAAFIVAISLGELDGDIRYRTDLALEEPL